MGEGAPICGAKRTRYRLARETYRAVSARWHGPGPVGKCWRSAAAVASVIAAPLLLTACGGASHHPTTTAAVLSAARSAADGTSSTTTSHTGSPGHRAAHPGVLARKRTSTHFVPATAKQRVLLAASSACAFARIGAPPAPIQSAKPDSWRRYAAAAHRFALRIASSLQKVPSAHRLLEVQRLIGDYRHLAQVYASGGSTASLAKAIAVAEQRAGAHALAGRVPTCAPSPRPATEAKR